MEQRKAEWIAQPMSDVSANDFEPYSSSGYTPNEIKSAYNLPASGGDGATIAIIVAYDTPNIQTYLAIFSAEYGLPAPDSSNFEIHKMTDTYAPDPNDRWSLETCLDVEWAHAIAPQAKILLVEAVNDYGNPLLAAVDYATSRPDVVAVSMSWGGQEDAWMLPYDTYFDKPMAFFAASGNNGAQVNWPAVSPYVVAVGGTTLSLAGDGSVSSETAWSKSSGGISAYFGQPNYQTNFGLPGSQRSVPDVSYNADSSIGYSVYCESGWRTVGGTSAGAPQWAAIYAIDKSATHANLYKSAKTNYAASFRDISTGSNGYSATVGYDYVTGLGSPVTTNYDFGLDVTPNEGPGSGDVTLTGTSFTEGGTVNIEYFNPQTITWTSVVTSLSVSSQTFTYTTTAPDLQFNNVAGDHTTLYDNIVYRATDNSNGRTVNSTNPYMEMRRGLTSVGSAAASGIFGNNTDLSAAVAVYSGQTVTITGKWFKPGTVAFTWDGTPGLGAATVDGTGSFTATVTVPTGETGQHTITLNDGSCGFCFDLTLAAMEPLTTLPEGPQIALFTTAFTALALVLWVKKNRVAAN